jgi:hypothetical protein
LPTTEPNGTLDRETSERLRDQLQRITEEAGAFLPAEHPAIKALFKAAEELSVATAPRWLYPEH